MSRDRFPFAQGEAKEAFESARQEWVNENKRWCVTALLWSAWPAAAGVFCWKMDGFWWWGWCAGLALWVGWKLLMREVDLLKKLRAAVRDARKEDLAAAWDDKMWESRWDEMGFAGRSARTFAREMRFGKESLALKAQADLENHLDEESEKRRRERALAGAEPEIAPLARSVRL